MKWLQAGVTLVALSAASYAWAAGPEAMLGGKMPAGGKPASMAGKALTRSPMARSGADLGVDPGRAAAVLSGLQPEGRLATRGAKEMQIYKAAAPAVVLIVTKDAIGSGVLISTDGKIVTNYHVVGDEDEVGVVFKPAQEGATPDKADLRRAKVLRRDEVADLALIQASETPPGVTPLKVAETISVGVGADVHAIGHPTGNTWTYTQGIVSQIRRDHPWRTRGDKAEHRATVIQTQTPINPGNSGGPLLDDDMEVIGINSFVSDGEGLNFAVSADDVRAFLARTEDRVSDKPEAEAVCELEVLSEAPSDDPKGMVYVVDENCDGEADFVLTEPVSKKQPVTLSYDNDGNGEIDMVIYDDNRDGKPDGLMMDTDGNGKPDMMGYYRKGEDEPYRYERIEER